MERKRGPSQQKSLYEKYLEGMSGDSTLRPTQILTREAFYNLPAESRRFLVSTSHPSFEKGGDRYISGCPKKGSF